MYRHNLLLIYRNFKRFKSTFFINLTGLSAGLACTLMIYLWVNDELHVDKFHENDERLYKVMTNEQSANGIITSEGTDASLDEALVHEMPEVKYATVIAPPSWFQKFTLSVINQNVNAAGLFVGKDYFNVFSYPLIQGDKNQVLTDKNSIVISEQLAHHLFQTTENVIGKTIEWKWFDQKKQCTVTGLFKNVPTASTYQFDFVLSFESWKDIIHASSDLGPGGPFQTFVVLKQGADVDVFNDKIAHFIKDKFEKSSTSLFLSSYSDMYLFGKYENGKQEGGRIIYVKLFSVIAVFILLIACINFMNLFTARASRRMKEVGIKKAMGASRRALIFQYLGESMMMSFVSSLIALLIVDLAMNQFNEVTGKHLSMSFDLRMIEAFIGITIITGIIAGSYPALFLSGFNPVSVLKGKISNSFGELWARKGLVLLQFTLSILFIVAVIAVYKQIQFVQSKNLGYQKDNIIYFDMEGRISENPETFLSEIKSIPGVMNASSIQQKIILPSAFGARGIRWEGKNQDDQIRFTQIPVNYELIETLGMKMKEGRAFSKEFHSGSDEIIFNETAIKLMDLENPVGKKVNIWGTDKLIVGVVKDFHFESFYENVKPFFFQLSPKETMVVMIRLDAGKQEETISRIKQFYKSYNAGFVLDYRFLDQDYQAQYVAEQRVAKLSRYFAGLAILISCLGLFGLAAFTAERKQKEISIRKVLGSGELDIVYLLTADFTKVVLASIGIALPIGYLITNYWLNGFAYKAEISFWYFIGAGLAALFIAWLTVGTQALKAARTNPTQYLKQE